MHKTTPKFMWLWIIAQEINKKNSTIHSTVYKLNYLNSCKHDPPPHLMNKVVFSPGEKLYSLQNFWGF